tara:strand:- start:2095 stop:2721 length:627 start_codon:yes stop_codon:yes gene_type:complete
MTDLDVKMVPDEPLSNPANDSSKAQIDGVLNAPPELLDDDLIMPPEPEPELVLKVKEVVEEEEVFKDVKPMRVKRKATAKQLEHLAKAREKAMVTRKANKIKKDEEKLDKLKGLSPKVIKNDNPDDLKVKQTIQEQYPTFKQFTNEDIIKLQEDAISSYEVKRKARKVKKKEDQLINTKKQKDYDAVAKAVSFQSIPNQDDPWAMCFQ